MLSSGAEWIVETRPLYGYASVLRELCALQSTCRKGWATYRHSTGTGWWIRLTAYLSTQEWTRGYIAQHCFGQLQSRRHHPDLGLGDTSGRRISKESSPDARRRRPAVEMHQGWPTPVLRIWRSQPICTGLRDQPAPLLLHEGCAGCWL